MKRTQFITTLSEEQKKKTKNKNWFVVKKIESFSRTKSFHVSNIRESTREWKSNSIWFFFIWFIRDFTLSHVEWHIDQMVLILWVNSVFNASIDSCEKVESNILIASINTITLMIVSFKRMTSIVNELFSFSISILNFVDLSLHQIVTKKRRHLPWRDMERERERKRRRRLGDWGRGSTSERASSVF